jgi:hypothetical protein
MFLKKEEKSSDNFWQELEEKTGEKILSRGLGKYVSGWGEFDNNKWGGIWGLIFTTSGGFRFHHFPQYSWMDAFTTQLAARFAEKQQPQEKTFFIPKDKIISIDHIYEKKWWKRIFSPSPPQLVVKYTAEDGSEEKLLFEAEYTAAGGDYAVQNG